MQDTATHCNTLHHSERNEPSNYHELKILSKLNPVAKENTL